MKILSKITNKLHRRILNIALRIIQKHVSKQKDLFIYTYKRSSDTLTPITWKARGVTQETRKQLTNDWNEVDKIIDYSGKIVVDVGASLGATAVPFSKSARKVFAIEPHIDNYNFLLDQLRVRDIKNIYPHKIAVSDFNGKAEFFNRESHGIHSLGVHNKGKVLSSFEVDVSTLDEFWKRNINEPIGLLKVDVEGFEADVFKGAKHLLENKLIDYILFEFSPRIHKMRNIDTFLPIKILLENDYKVLTTSGVDFEINNKNIPKICDLIATPK